MTSAAPSQARFPKSYESATILQTGARLTTVSFDSSNEYAPEIRFPQQLTPSLYIEGRGESWRT